MATNARDGDLLDELLLDIFARLPDPVDLLRCAGTCTRWFRLLAADDAAFLRRVGVLPQNRNASVLLGAFYQNDYLVPGSATVNDVSDCPPRFWRLDDLARPGIGLFSKHDGLFNYAQPLATRHGLLLVRLMPAPLDHRKLHLAVCHPLLGGVHLVPPPPLHLHSPFLGRDLTGYALVTGYGGEGLDSHRQRRLAFRVLFTAVSLDEVVCAYSYSSATGNWSAPLACPVQLRGLTMSGPRAGVVDDRGTVHWLYRSETSFYSLDVSADAARVSLTKMPMQVQLPPPFPCIGAGGKLVVEAGKPTPDAALALRRTAVMHRYVGCCDKLNASAASVDYRSHQMNARLEVVENHRLDGVVFDRLRQIRCPPTICSNFSDLDSVQCVELVNSAIAD
ncbi:hypothetical protein ACQ4PT_022561 [Festuca glaucescens]